MDILEAKKIAVRFASSFPNYELAPEYVGELNGGVVFFFKSLVHGKHVGIPFYCFVEAGEASVLEPPLVFKAMKMRRQHLANN